MTKALVDLDDDLLTRAQQLLGTRTKKDTVNRALSEVVGRVDRAEILDFFTSGALDLEVLKEHDSAWRP